jgi:hypothetical protein
VFIAVLRFPLPMSLGGPQPVGNTSLTMQQLSLEKISFFVVAGAMPAKGKSSFLYGCNPNTAKSEALLLLQWHQ